MKTLLFPFKNCLQSLISVNSVNLDYIFIIYRHAFYVIVQLVCQICFLVGFQSDWSSEGIVGSSERYGGHATVFVGGYDNNLAFMFINFTFSLDLITLYGSVFDR